MISLVAVLALAPPPPPAVEPEGAEGEGQTEQSEGEGQGEGEGDPELDFQRDPILPFGDAEDPTAKLEYADPPEEPQLEYGEPPAQPNAEYDQRLQRPAPPREALTRQDPTVTGEAFTPKRVESPQRFALELKFGPYLPSVDRSYDGPGFGPYANIYGRTDSDGNTNDDPRMGLYSVLGFEWQFYHLGGPFLVGTQIGYFRDTADALVAEPDPDGPVRSSADTTAFNVIPISLLVGYRFELLADRFKVPLVPYAKGGLSYGFWWSTDGNGNVSQNSRGEKGHGGSIGWQVNLGLMLRLDFLERGVSHDLDRQTGINHTYIFGEYQFSRLNGFGVGNRVDVGDDTFLVGLAIAF